MTWQERDRSLHGVDAPDGRARRARSTPTGPRTSSGASTAASPGPPRDPASLRRPERAARRSDQRVGLRRRNRRARSGRPHLRRRVPQHEGGKHLDREQPLGRVRHRPRRRHGRAAHVYASAGYLGGSLPRGGAYASVDGGATGRISFLPALGAVRLALSDSGHILYAATSLGVYTLAGAGGPTTCTPDDQTLCLNDGRFRVTATWTKPDGSSGQGHAVTLTGDTGYFWFFDSTNVEVIVKVLEACGVNGHRWVFASGLTNVQVNLTVTDVVTGTDEDVQATPRRRRSGASRTPTAFPCRLDARGDGIAQPGPRGRRF